MVGRTSWSWGERSCLGVHDVLMLHDADVLMPHDAGTYCRYSLMMPVHTAAIAS